MVHVLRLFVAGKSDHSLAAIRNCMRLCEAHLDGKVDFQVVDVGESAEMAEKYNVWVTPTLLRLAPGPMLRVVGDLSTSEPVLSCFGAQRP